MAVRHLVSVRTIAEYACAHGSLKAGAFLRSRLREGTLGHKRVQEARPAGWEAEVTLSIDCISEGVSLCVRGRADLIFIDESRAYVGEIKTTRVDPDLILKDDYPEHWAQTEIYAYLLCIRENRSVARCELIYVNEFGREHRFRREYTVSELKHLFLNYVRPYAEYLKAGELWQETAAPTFTGLCFPFSTYREGQVDMADAIYEAMGNSSVIVEAPTGIGKTAAALYGAIRALGEGRITRIFYLTARTTGRRSAENALNLMRGSGLKLRSVTITAKEKACFYDKTDCGGCKYASGYYDRCRNAILEAMTAECLDESMIAEIAQAHELCPFELSLDLTMIADVVICDYNYVFDPRIRLKRHFEKRSHIGILVDEAHNLIDRSREMYSAEISGQEVRKLRTKMRETYAEGGAIDNAMTKLIDILTEEGAEYDARREIPEKLLEALADLHKMLEEVHPSDDEEFDFMMNCGWFLRVSRFFDDRSYRAMIMPEGKDDSITVKLWCFAPQEKLEKLYRHIGGAALFSATLAPVYYYGTALGVPDKTKQLTFGSPFPNENLYVARLPISVRFKDRNENMEKVARVIHCLSESHTGNYLACFPSYAYLSQAYKYYRVRYPDAAVIIQKSYMSDSDRTAFIENFHENPQKSMVAFIVLGGVFSEGIDLPGELLSGTCIVSTGIPLPNPESELLAAMNEDDAEEGMNAAYIYPGFRKVLQAAGRVIRTETDRGAVLLLDDRYVSQKYDELFPENWRVDTVKSISHLRSKLDAFWQG